MNHSLPNSKRQKILAEDPSTPPQLDNHVDEEILRRHVFSFLSVLDLRVAGLTCRKWRHLTTADHDLSLFFALTLPTTNELVLFQAPGSRKGEESGKAVIQRLKVQPSPRSRSIRRDAPEWPSCAAAGPSGQLFVSQYKVPGVLEYSRIGTEGYQYSRTFASGSAFESPEGLVCAHNSLYVVSADACSISRLSLVSGAIIDRIGLPRPYILWGMCINPDESCLYVAGHTERVAEGDFRTPTSEDTGAIMQIFLNRDGSFFSVVVKMPFSNRLNRPSNPAFCSHGIMHVPSYASTTTENGIDKVVRRVYRFREGPRPPAGNVNRDLHPAGWLDTASVEHRRILEQVWSISFASDDRLVAACHCLPSGGGSSADNPPETDNSSGSICPTGAATTKPAVFMTESCGCNRAGTIRISTFSAAPHDNAEERDSSTSYDCGALSVLATCDDFDQLECVLPN